MAAEPTQPSQSYRDLRHELQEFACERDAALEKFWKPDQNPRVLVSSSRPFEWRPPDPPAPVEEAYADMEIAAGRYIRRSLIEACPAAGALSRDQAWVALCRQLGGILHRSLGTTSLDQAHAETPTRERLLLDEPHGDLEHAAPADLRLLYRLHRAELKRRLFRVGVDQIKQLLDRRDSGEWWFLSPPAADGDQHRPVQPGPKLVEPASPAEPQMLRHPGRKPRCLTESFHLTERYLIKLAAILGGRTGRAAPTKDKLCRALNISRGTLNAFERQDGGLSDKMRAKISSELTDGPSQAVIDYFRKLVP
jgi:hypothetical protein